MYQKCLEKIDSGQSWDLEGQERNVIYTIIIFPCGKVYNGNWTEWSAIWSEIIRVISKSARSFGLKLQVWFQTKIAWHEVQLRLYYSHFEIAAFSQI